MSYYVKALNTVWHNLYLRKFDIVPFNMKHDPLGFLKPYQRAVLVSFVISETVEEQRKLTGFI